MLESDCLFGGGTLSRHQCPNCDLIFGPRTMRRLSAAGLAEAYKWHYRACPPGDSTGQALRAFYALAPRRDRSCLNDGTGGTSRSVQRLRQQGWNVRGFEPHDVQGSDGSTLRRLEQLQAQRFDGIFSNDVLEHLRDPVEELRFMAGLRRPQGRMAHATACFEYGYAFTRFHLFFHRALQRLDGTPSRAGD